MVFSEKTKSEVKRKAHFKCCICESFEFLHIHHIIPEADKGSDDFDNAAPLCTRCHDNFGANPEKRKWIREKRDFWYEFCEKRLHNEDVNMLEKTYMVIEEIHIKHEKRLDNAEKNIFTLQESVQYLTEQNRNLIDSLIVTPDDRRPELFSQISSGSVAITGTSSAISQLSREASGSICSKCGGIVKQEQKTIKSTPEGEPTKIRIRFKCQMCGNIEHDEIEDL